VSILLLLLCTLQKEWLRKMNSRVNAINTYRSPALWHAECAGRDRGMSGLDPLRIHSLSTMMRINSEEVYIKKEIQWLENCGRCLAVLQDAQQSQL